MFLKARGLSIAPEVAVGDGALGFWKALDETFPSTRHQHCWLRPLSPLNGSHLRDLQIDDDGP
jgi:hypothetical protein